MGARSWKQQREPNSQNTNVIFILAIDSPRFSPGDTECSAFMRGCRGGETEFWGGANLKSRLLFASEAITWFVVLSGGRMEDWFNSFLILMFWIETQVKKKNWVFLMNYLTRFRYKPKSLFDINATILLCLSVFNFSFFFFFFSFILNIPNLAKAKCNICTDVIIIFFPL